MLPDASEQTAHPALPGGAGKALYSWRISKASFARRSAILLALTFAFHGGLVPLDNVALWLASAVFWGLFLMWVMGDFDIWLRHRNVEWTLTERAITITDPDGDSYESTIPLSAIKRINRLALWSVTLRLENGQSQLLPLTPAPRALKTRIEAAMAENRSPNDPD